MMKLYPKGIVEEIEEYIIYQPMIGGEIFYHYFAFLYICIIA